MANATHFPKVDDDVPMTHMFNLSFLCLLCTHRPTTPTVVYEHKINFNWIDEVLADSATNISVSVFAKSVCLIKINNFVEGKTFEN